MPNYRSAKASGINSARLKGRNTPYSNATVLPLSGSSVGDLSFVRETNRLYIWGGTGWYSIALVNQSPSTITGNNATYTLSKTGTPTVVSLNSTDPEGIPLTWNYSVTSGTLGNTAVITQTSNVFTITPSVVSADAGDFTLTFTATDGINTETATSSFSLNFAADPGGVLFTTTGSHSWTCPAGVTSVCVVAIGGGASGSRGRSDVYRYGGPGGGLGWKNNISVTPGQTYTVVVGAGGTASGAGSDSYFINTSTVKGGGGQIPTATGNNGTTVSGGGNYVGDGGGNGGSCANAYDAAYAGGGGGAGGYSGAGGSGGGGASNTVYPGSGSGGGGGGGGGAGAYYSGGGGGGGVGVYGSGSNGASGSNGGFQLGGTGGTGGSSGTNGGEGGGQYGVGGTPGLYGAGSGSGDNRPSGGNGAVRIIWGTGRAFPSTNVDLASSTAGETTI